MNLARIKAMIELARSEPGMVVHADDWDPDPYILNVDNGVLDLRTGELHKHHPRFMCTKIAPTPWRGEAYRDERWSGFLRTALAGDTELNSFLSRCAYESLTGTIASKMAVNLFDDGLGNTGKSAMLSCLLQTMGTGETGYAAQVNSDVFLTSRHGRSLTQEGELALCDGKRLVVSSEIPAGARISEAFLKRLTEGGINARYMYRQKNLRGWEGRLSFTIWLDGNNTAEADPNDEAWWARWRLVKFTHQIPEAERVPGWADRMCADPDFRAAVLSWAMRGRESYWANGGQVGNAGSVVAATREVRTENDPLVDFWLPFEFGDKLWISNKELDEALAEYQAESMSDVDKRDVIQSLTNLGCQRKSKRYSGAVVRGWAGLRWKG